MKRRVAFVLLAGALVFSGAPAQADNIEGFDGDGAGGELPAYMQCVPYAREVTGIQIYGDAWTWWDQAAGRYARGNTPRAGAVMAFEPYGSMSLGHVAAVSKVLDSRTVLLRHANWSPIDGHRGQIEDDVKAVDVSPDNDWSEVRVWYAPIGGLGTTAWPVAGFIYPDKGSRPAYQVASASSARSERVAPSRDFLKTFASFDAPTPAREPLGATHKKAKPPIDLIAQIASR